MNEEHLTRFEANIERLVESAFANFFGRKLRAQDIALQLARAMEDGAKAAPAAGDRRPLAPDAYMILLNPQLYAYLTQTQPNLPQKLGQYLLMLASQTGYRLNNIPLIEFAADATLERHRLKVAARHTDRPENSTAGMQRVTVAMPEMGQPVNAALLIDASRSVRLEQDIINIGRYRDNDIVLDDPHVSRHHLQLRRRGGLYLLFDLHSQTGTFVNGVRVKEHRLQSGDVIQSGRTRLVYMEENTADDGQLPQTDSLDPVN